MAHHQRPIPGQSKCALSRHRSTSHHKVDLTWVLLLVLKSLLTNMSPTRSTNEMKNCYSWRIWPKPNHMLHMQPSSMATYTSFLSLQNSFQYKSTSKTPGRLHSLSVNPIFTGRAPPSDTDREILALPVRLGGLGIVNPPRSHPLSSWPPLTSLHH